MNLNLFDYQDLPEPECDHLPLSQRVFRGDWLYCGRCGKVLRHKDMTQRLTSPESMEVHHA